MARILPVLTTGFDRHSSSACYFVADRTGKQSLNSSRRLFLKSTGRASPKRLSRPVLPFPLASSAL